MIASAPSQVARAQRRADTSAFLARVFLAHELGATDVERCTGVPRQHVAAWLDRDDARAMPLADATALPERTRLVVAEHIAGPGHVVVRLPSATAHPGDDLRLAARAQREASDAVAVLLDALADGHITAQEGAELRTRAEALLATVATVLELAREAEREGVVSIERARRAGAR
jgi:hypothetical protein